jgi:hypothetical protein
MASGGYIWARDLFVAVAERDSRGEVDAAGGEFAGVPPIFRAGILRTGGEAPRDGGEQRRKGGRDARLLDFSGGQFDFHGFGLVSKS